jgi:hypothetical protein
MHAVSVLAAATIRAGTAGRQSDAANRAAFTAGRAGEFPAAMNRPLNNSAETQQRTMFRFAIRGAEKGAPNGQNAQNVTVAHLEHRLW